MDDYTTFIPLWRDHGTETQEGGSSNGPKIISR